MSYEQFGPNFIRMILHKERVLTSIDRLLGDRIELGPMGAGPGRVFAKITAVGTFGATYGEEVPGDLLAYDVFLPISVVFDLDLAVDTHRFDAEVLVPLRLTVRVEEPLTIVWDIEPPDINDVVIRVVTGTRRGTFLQRISGLDEELRRFLVKVIAKEFQKPHVRRATRIDMVSVIDGAWPQIAGQFLPNGPEDRIAM